MNKSNNNITQKTKYIILIIIFFYFILIEKKYHTLLMVYMSTLCAIKDERLCVKISDLQKKEADLIVFLQN